MLQIEFGRWTLSVDPASTGTAYSQRNEAAPESCGCAPCLNYVANRSTCFPATVLHFLATAGIPVCQEAEVYHNCRLPSGLHSYGGWYHFVGRIEVEEPAAAEGSHEPYRLTSRFSAAITPKAALVPAAFSAHNALQLNFFIEIPWIIDAQEPN